MTSIELDLDVEGALGSRQFSKKVAWVKSVPDTQKIVPESHGFSTVITQKNGVLEFSQHAPILGQVFVVELSEVGVHSIEETIDGVKFKGTVKIS